MAASGTLTVAAGIIGTPLGQEISGPLSVTNSASVGQITQVVLQSGANTVAVPAGSLAVVIVMPSGNTNSVTLKGVTGDTGIPLSTAGLAGAFVFPAAPPTSIVLTSGGTNSSATYILFL